MRILILANNDLGLYNFRKELIDKLIELNNKVYISLPYGERVEDLKNAGCQYIETDIDRRGTSILKDFKLMLKYRKIVKDVKPDVILTYTIKPNIYGGIVARITKTRYIANITGLGTALENQGLLQKITIKLYKVALKKVDCCFVQNEENLKFITKNIGDKLRYQLIPGSGVNLDRFKELEYPKENDKMIFLFIGRIMKEKGIDQYIDVAKYITRKYDNTEFHILGFCEQEYEEELKELEEQNIIKYYGRQDDIISYLSKSCCIIHPSYYPEGMSNVLLESSSSGRPVITTNRSGCRETVENGKTGYIVGIKNSKELIEAVEKFINLPYEEKRKMGKNARKKMEKEFDRNIVINGYINEINKIKR